MCIKTKDPSRIDINTLIDLRQSGQTTKAKKACIDLLKKNPQSLVVLSILADIFQEQGEVKQAVKVLSKLIYQKPDFAEAYSNRGNALRDLGQLNSAVASYDQAIALKPDFAEAYSNRGCALQDLGQFDIALISHRNATSIQPDHGLLWAGLAQCLKSVRFVNSNDNLIHELFHLLGQSTVSPQEISDTVISALRRYPKFLFIFDLFKSNGIDRKNIDFITEELSAIPLILRLMELCSIFDAEVESMLSKIRFYMLDKEIDRLVGSEKILPFYVSLAVHCFTNEYVYSETEEEKKKIEFLQSNLEIDLQKGISVFPTNIAVLAAYRPLSSFLWVDDLLKSKSYGNIKKIITEQVDNVRLEKDLRNSIPRITKIEDKVSQSVLSQYEENPYPRWIRTGLNYKPKSINKVLTQLQPEYIPNIQQVSDKLEILVAGCGTGQHALRTASMFTNCHVLAVDLSMRSLSYAVRKTRELGVKNISYAQGDIINLREIGREFDVIESVGVLHHMNDPVLGWKILAEMLRPEGLMYVGLYSGLARQHVTKLRKYIDEEKYTTSPDDIRKFRSKIIRQDVRSDLECIKIKKSRDFYSLSACRDLLFHVQEHCFTLPEIDEILKKIGLRFIGFQLKNSSITNFKKFYSEKDAIKSLPFWHQFELLNPETFIDMYQFWVQKS